ncbi:hypothetical protein MHU86_22852 [Fragilaria crotonensis]|nr:hypothetical protein MHU86_22852 [Fragilaria crotonensis]
MTALILTAILFMAIHPTALHGLSNNRHLCLFKSYSLVRGPHFSALFDQLIEQTGFDDNNAKRIAFLTIDNHRKHPDLIHNDLGLDDIATFRLDQMNPIEMTQRIQEFDPSVLWVADANSAFQLRYYMRTSGLDGLVENLCGSIQGKSLLYVGEGAGVICAGSHMALAKGQDQAPEPQFRGLELLGLDTSVTFDPSPPPMEGTITSLRETQLYVWSQRDGKAMSFVVTPDQRGAIEGMRNPKPLPPLVEESVGGRRCIGEPSVDPSRMLQMRGDSEWFEGDA